MKLYMMVTKDEYELPLGVYDSLDELVEKQKVRKEYVKQSIWQYEKGKANYRTQFRKVFVED